MGPKEELQKLAATPIFAQILNEISSSVDLRRSVVERIEGKTERRFAAYITVFGMSPAGIISPDDVVPFRDLITSMGTGIDLDLMVHSPGGLPDVAEKLAGILQAHCASIRVVVPSMAKSAATLLSLACHEIIMSDTSELGPTDPQMPHMNPTGGWEYLPAHSFIDAYEELVEEVNQRGSLLPADIPRFRQIDLAFVNSCRKAVEHSRTLGETWLTEGQLKSDHAKAAETARKLAEGKDYLSHGRVIDWKHAREELGLNVTYLPAGDELWEAYWEYYVRAELYLRQTNQFKLFENADVSAGMGGG